MIDCTPQIIETCIGLLVVHKIYKLLCDLNPQPVHLRTCQLQPKSMRHTHCGKERSFRQAATCSAFIARVIIDLMQSTAEQFVFQIVSL